MPDPNSESFDRMYNLYKHLTTLDTATIVILAAFFLKSGGNTSANWLIDLCLLALIVSLVGCVAGMFGATASIDVAGDPKPGQKLVNLSIKFAILQLAFSAMLFIIGIGSLGLFVIANI